ncbi:MAG: sugar phosphate nucleotidyltransferase [Bdellovibrionales bacterium]
MSHAIVLAGGLATRLYPLTENMAKCLVPCGNRPFVDYSLAWMAETGVTETTFVLGHFGDQVAAHLSTLDVRGMKINWIHEGEIRLGTGGAITKALGANPLKEFLVVYGDSFLPTNFADISSPEAKALMTVFHNKNAFDASNVHFANGWVEKYSKDKEVQKREDFQHIDYGISYWKSDYFQKHRPQAEVWDLAQLMSETAARGDMRGLEVKERFFEIGSPAGYQEFQDLIAGKVDRPLANMIHSTLKRIGRK